MSTSTIRACACGLRTVWPQSIPAAERSLAYANSPVTFGVASMRLTTSPTRPSSSWRAGGLTARGAVARAGGRSCSPLGRQPDRVEDLRVARAAAEVAGQRLADLVVARRRVALQQVGGRDDQPRRAEAALHGASLAERLLHAVELALARETLDGDDLVALRLRRQHHARADQL